MPVAEVPQMQLDTDPTGTNGIIVGKNRLHANKLGIYPGAVSGRAPDGCVRGWAMRVKRVRPLVAAAVAAGVVAIGVVGRTPDATHWGRVAVMRRLASVRRGRPRKFNRPARTVSVTLPEDVIAALRAVDPDLSRAIVQAVLPVVATRTVPKSAELTTFGNRGLILVRRSRALKQMGIDLLPLPDGKALITLDEAMSTAELELRLHDALENAAIGPDDRAVIAELLQILRTARRDRTVALHERRVILLQWQPSNRTVAGDARGASESA